MLYPQFAERDCQSCVKYDYNDETGEQILHFGKPLLRHRKNPPLCKRAGGCPRGTPEKQNYLSKKNWQAFQHWKECKATGCFPDDETVRWNASIIQDVVDRADEMKRIEGVGSLTALLTGMLG